MKNEDEMRRAIYARPTVKFEEDYWSAVSNECKAFIADCLDSDAKKRLSAERALKSAWFKKKPPSKWRTSKKKKLEQQVKQ